MASPTTSGSRAARASPCMGRPRTRCQRRLSATEPRTAPAPTMQNSPAKERSRFSARVSSARMNSSWVASAGVVPCPARGDSRREESGARSPAASEPDRNGLPVAGVSDRAGAFAGAATVSGVWLATERTAGRAGERGAAGMFRASQNESSPAAANHASHSGRRQGGRRRFTSFSPAPEKGIRPGARAWRPAPRRGVRPPCPGARRTGSSRPVPVPAARAGLPCSGRS